MKIGIDIMAGDHSPKENINGVTSYLNKTKNLRRREEKEENRLSFSFLKRWLAENFF